MTIDPSIAQEIQAALRKSYPCGHDAFMTKAGICLKHMPTLLTALEAVSKERDEALVLVSVAQSQRDDAWKSERYLLGKLQELRERYEPAQEP